MVNNPMPPTPAEVRVVLQQHADDAVGAAVEAMYRGDPAVVVSAPPGSGKTGLVERLAATGVLMANERVAVATTTVAQSFDVAHRCAVAYPEMAVTLFARAGLEIPEPLGALENLSVARRIGELDGAAGVVVGTAAKWAWTETLIPYDALIVDEAWQLADAAFAQIAGVGERVVLVGDPGQIAPVVTVDVRRWQGRVDGPHVACPEVLLARRGDHVRHIKLPATRRLPGDTVAMIGEPFYPSLPFGSLRARTGVRLGAGFGELADLVAESASLVQLTVPGEGSLNDPGLADTVLELVQRLCRDGEIETPTGWCEIGARDIAVVCAHVTQVAAVQGRLRALGIDGVLCDTAERLQGLERAVVIAWHPGSGRRDASTFSLDAGRWCVMLSRHTHLAIVVARDGVADLYAQASAGAERILGVAANDSHRGWRCHVELLETLERHARILTFPTS